MIKWQANEQKRSCNVTRGRISMSRIYNYNQLAAIPPSAPMGPESFNDGVSIARVGIEELVGERLVAGAILFGSAIQQSTDPCSDIDGLVAVYNLDEETVYALQGVVDRVRAATSLPLSLTVRTVGKLRQGRHDEHPAKVAWMQSQVEAAPSLVIGTNPLEFIAPLTRDILVSSDDFLSNHAYSMIMALVHGIDGTVETTLGQVLNTPHRAGRRALQALAWVGYLPSEVGADMRKHSITNSVAGIFGAYDLRITQLQEDLVVDFNRYFTLIEQVRSGAIGRNEYDQQLRATLAHDLPKAIELTNRIQAVYRKLAKLAQEMGPEVQRTF